MDLLSSFGNIASLIGLGITIYIFLDVRKLKKAFLFNVRADELANDLELHAASLLKLLDQGHKNFSSDHAQSLIIPLDPTLKNLQEMTRGSTKKLIKSLRRKVKVQRQRGVVLDFDVTRQFHNDIKMLITDLKNLQENRRLTAN